MSVNGGRTVDNNFTLNGANFTSFAQATGVNYPPPDAVQEIRIQTHNFTAEYGNAASAQVSVVSKAGTNQLHGAAWEFLRNEKLNARSFFQPRRPTTKQNQAGFAAGGPVRKNRLFAFGSYQRLWNRPETGASQVLVLTDAERQGDFSASQGDAPEHHRSDYRAAGDGPRRAALPGGQDHQPRLLQPGREEAARPVRAALALRRAWSSCGRRRATITPGCRGSISSQAPSTTCTATFSGPLRLSAFAPGSFPGYADGNRRVDTYDIGLNSTYTFSPTFLSETVVSYLHDDSFGAARPSHPAAQRGNRSRPGRPGRRSDFERDRAFFAHLPHAGDAALQQCPPAQLDEQDLRPAQPTSGATR